MAKRENGSGTVDQAGAPINGQLASPLPPGVLARPDAPDEGRYVTFNDYWANYYTHADASYEWNNGYLEAKPLSTLAQYRLFLWFLKLLHEYATFYDNAELMSLETGFTMTVPDPASPGVMKKVVRKPDLAAILRTNPIQWGEHDHSYKGICDLCVESLSDSSVKEMLRDTQIKKSEYAFAGVQEYYILDPENEYMVFYALSAIGDYVEIQPDAEGVIRSQILPGFQFRRRDLTRLPSLEDLIDDAVYPYVLPGYRAALDRIEQEQQRAEQAQRRAEQEQRRAEQEQRRAEQEQQRAEQEQQRAEYYANRLRQLGIDVDAL
ncbi:MAG: Uma2 family endonuclease [Caldilineaceae bacterium]|nr:Uma2 family endonuclease [Caldilineaceae bacterium]